MRVLISGGGTGGHIYPALAVAQELRRRDPGTVLLCVGRQGRLDRSLVERAGLELEEIQIHGLDRDAPLRNLSLPLLVPLALVRAVSIVRRFAPDAVLATGGDVSLPVVLGARLCGVPSVLLEPNAEPGLSTRILARSARWVAISFPEARARLRGSHLVETGTPLRAEFQAEWSLPVSPPRRLLVFGGSLGAHRLNEALGQVLTELLDLGLEVDHICGHQDLDQMSEIRDRLRPELAPAYRPLAYAHDLSRLMAEADLAVSRAGAGAIAELTISGRPAILVPGAFGGGHQRANALSMVRAGAARLLEDRDLTGSRLLQEIRSLVQDPGLLAGMAQASRALGRPGAASAVADLLAEASTR